MLTPEQWEVLSGLEIGPAVLKEIGQLNRMYVKTQRLVSRHKEAIEVYRDRARRMTDELKALTDPRMGSDPAFAEAARASALDSIHWGDRFCYDETAWIEADLPHGISS